LGQPSRQRDQVEDKEHRGASNHIRSVKNGMLIGKEDQGTVQTQSQRGKFGLLRSKREHAASSFQFRFMNDNVCGLNWSAKHLREVYSQESESPKFFADVGLDAARSCPAGIVCSRKGRFSSASIDAASGWCFRLFLAARGYWRPGPRYRATCYRGISPAGEDIIWLALQAGMTRATIIVAMR
jgi:hypothetical protein